MKVLTVSNMYPSEADPVYGTFVKNFVNELKLRNPHGVNDIAVIAGRRKGKMAKSLAYFKFYSSLVWKLLSRKYDIVYVHTITFPILPLRFVLMFKRLNLVFNVHGDDVLPNTRMKERLKDIARPVVPKATMIVVPSEYFRGVVLKEFEGVKADRIFVSPSGGLHRRFYVNPSRDGAEKGLILGYVSRIDEGKGWDVFVEAIARLNDMGVDCKGIIAGRGAQSQQLQQMIVDRGLTQRINYLGPVAQERLPEVYSSVDLFIFPSVRTAESLGLVGLEAMAAHTPVAASNMAGPAGYVNDGENGYLFTPGDVDALIKCVKLYQALGASQRKEMADNAYETALKYRADDVAENLYRRLIEISTKS